MITYKVVEQQERIEKGEEPKGEDIERADQESPTAYSKGRKG